jgi:hypothetical protein
VESLDRACGATIVTMSVRLEFLDGPAAGIVQDAGWSTALPSLHWINPDRTESGVVYRRDSRDADPATGRWTYHQLLDSTTPHH